MNQKERHYRRHEDAKPAYSALMKVYPLTVEDLDGEVWKPINDYDGYQVSNYGRGKSFKKGKVKILKPALCMGYLRVTLWKDNKPKPFRIHRLVAELFIPNPEGKPEVNHIDGNKFNNYVGNLEWATSSENQRHAVATGLQAQGEDNYLAKLTNEQVLYIRQNPDSLTLEKLAEKFGVNFGTISAIQLGKHYKNAGGSVREKKRGGYPRVPDEIREQIRADYATGNFTQVQLAKKYGISQTTIWKILHED